jgi:farnesyl-diphosphate farnesyltransferase
MHTQTRAAASGLEDPKIAKDKSLANHMGLFLQKTNIIRDYLVSARLLQPTHL